MRVIFLPLNIAGTASSLVRAMRGQGVEAENWVIARDWLEFESDRVFSSANLERRTLQRWRSEVAKFRMLSYLGKTDVVVYCFGSTVFTPARGYFRWWNVAFWLIYNAVSIVLQVVELVAARLLGIRVVVIFQGNDARRRGFAKNFEIHFANVRGTFSYLGDTVKRYQSFLFGMFAHDIYFLNPDLGHVLPARARFLAYPSVFVDDFLPHYPSRESHSLVVGHAPTSRSIKGTNLLLDAISQLEDQGIAINLKLIENKSHAEAVELYKEVDVFVDQLYAGWYGAVAVELMALGKPVIAYIRESDLVFVDQSLSDDLPIVRCKPGDIKEVLLALATTRRGELGGLGRDGRRFAKRWHDPHEIASNILDVIRMKDESQRAEDIA